jgi:hypothetical protein
MRQTGRAGLLVVMVFLSIGGKTQASSSPQEEEIAAIAAATSRTVLLLEQLVNITSAFGGIFQNQSDLLASAIFQLSNQTAEMTGTAQRFGPRFVTIGDGAVREWGSTNQFIHEDLTLWTIAQAAACAGAAAYVGYKVVSFSMGALGKLVQRCRGSSAAEGESERDKENQVPVINSNASVQEGDPLARPLM